MMCRKKCKTGEKGNFKNRTTNIYKISRLDYKGSREGIRSNQDYKYTRVVWDTHKDTQTDRQTQKITQTKKTFGLYYVIYFLDSIYWT